MPYTTLTLLFTGSLLLLLHVHGACLSPTDPLSPLNSVTEISTRQTLLLLHLASCPFFLHVCSLPLSTLFLPLCLSFSCAYTVSVFLSSCSVIMLVEERGQTGEDPEPWGALSSLTVGAPSHVYWRS